MEQVHSDERSCELRLMLNGSLGADASYDAEAGACQSLTLEGIVHDPPDHDWPIPRATYGEPDRSAPHFHGKAAYVNVSSPPWETRRKARVLQETPNACGYVIVKAGVKPKTFGDEFGRHEIEPVSVHLEVSSEAFEVIRRQAAEAYERRLIFSMKVTLVGDRLPPVDEERCLEWRLSDLDVSADQTYPLRKVETIVTGFRGPVRPVRQSLDDRRSTISLLITETTFDLDPVTASVTAMSCNGRVVDGTFQGRNVSVDFVKPSYLDRYEYLGGVPLTELAGQFAYDPDPSYGGFAFRLHYDRDDNLGALIPYLTTDAGTELVMKVRIDQDAKELLKAKDDVSGKVISYAFALRRRFRAQESGHVIAAQPGYELISLDPGDYCWEPEDIKEMAEVLPREPIRAWRVDNNGTLTPFPLDPAEGVSTAICHPDGTVSEVNSTRLTRFANLEEWLAEQRKQLLPLLQEKADAKAYSEFGCSIEDILHKIAEDEERSPETRQEFQELLVRWRAGQLDRQTLNYAVGYYRRLYGKPANTPP